MPAPRPTRQINLLRGWPSPTLLPTQLLRRAADRTFESTYNNTSAPSTYQSSASSPLSASAQASSRPLDYASLALSEQALLYGPDEGHLPLRKALSKWLGEFYGSAIRRAYPECEGRVGKHLAHAVERHMIPYDRITITGGASQSIEVILSAVTDPTFTRKIWVVAPGYFMAFKIFRDAGFAAKGRIVAVPEITFAGKGERGPDVKWLRERMAKCEREWKDSGGAVEPQLKPSSAYPKIYKHIIYTVPSFANPSSITTSLGVREDLVRCAREFDALVICDDVYDMLQWPASPQDKTTTAPLSNMSPNPDSTDVALLPRLVDVDSCLAPQEEDQQSEYGNVVSNGSFSKICGPGCRNGWVEAMPALAYLISQEGAQKSGGAPGQLVSTFLCDMLEQGDLQRHVRDVLRPAYEGRWRTLVNAVGEVLVPLGVRMPTPHGSNDDIGGNDVEMGHEVQRAGGYFIWLTLPRGVSERRVTQRCLEEENLIVAGGRLFEIPGDDSDENNFGDSIRLCFAWEAEEELEEGVARLGRVLSRELKTLEAGTVHVIPGRGDSRNEAGQDDFTRFG